MRYGQRQATEQELKSPQVSSWRPPSQHPKPPGKHSQHIVVRRETEAPPHGKGLHPGTLGQSRAGSGPRMPGRLLSPHILQLYSRRILMTGPGIIHSGISLGISSNRCLGKGSVTKASARKTLGRQIIGKKKKNHSQSGLSLSDPASHASRIARPPPRGTAAETPPQAGHPLSRKAGDGTGLSAPRGGPPALPSAHRPRQRRPSLVRLCPMLSCGAGLGGLSWPLKKAFRKAF